jgi:GNAT superfamily N-acetyltransferase
MKQLIRRALHAGLGDYRINWIVASAALHAGPFPELTLVDAAILAAIEASPTEKVRHAATFNRAGMTGWAMLIEGRLACVAHFADHRRYMNESTWPLGANEICLVDIVTEEAERGKGHAVKLIEAATEMYRRQGHERLIAFIWWSNEASSRSFAKAGWRRIGLSVEAKIGERWFTTKLPWPG